MKISIITIGDEICIGQIINSNAAWIANQCTMTGAQVILHSTVGDEKSAIIGEIERLSAVSDMLILTGGLGPTHDDITKETLIDYYNDKLQLDEKTLALLKTRYEKRGMILNERNQLQAMLPSKCRVLSNSVGSAPGMLFDENGKILISLPGVPMEMKDIMTKHVIPFIKRSIEKAKDEIVLYKNILTAGIPESNLADLLGEPDNFLGDCSLAFLPSYQGVRLRIGVKNKDVLICSEKLDQVKKYIESKAGKYIFGYDDDSLASACGMELIRRNKTLAVAESCSGGMLGAAFTDISGSSAYFKGGLIAYSNEIKDKLLRIDTHLLSEFGAVSKECAEAMAINALKLFNCDYSLSITGIAGPTGGSDDKPVGTVWIALAAKGKVRSGKYYFSTERKINRERAVATALNMLWKELKGIEK